MKFNFKKILPIILLTCFIVVPAEASSLWRHDSSLFSDRKASTVGDIVMVNVTEEIDDSDEGKSNISKTTNDNIGSGFGILDFIRSFGLGSSSSMNNKTKIERTKELEMVVSCIVTDVTPNGNLVIQGDRILTSGAEKMNVRFSGVVRQQDIDYKNTVDSERVANAEIVVSGRGTISSTQRPGLIGQILRAVF